MPEENIKYESDLSKVTITSVREEIQSKLDSKKIEYDSILANFTSSKCMQATELRTMINKEKEVVDTLINFYMELLLMLENAGKDIDTTEQKFSGQHLESEDLG